MTVLSPTAIVGMALPSLAPASSSAGPSGAGLGARIDVDWRSHSDAKRVKTAKELRASLAKAKAKVEARAETKAERLARQEGPARQTGSDAERRDTRGSVAKAAAALADVPMDSDFSGKEYRDTRIMLRQLYPGARLSDILAKAAELEQLLVDDPVNAHQSTLE